MPTEDETLEAQTTIFAQRILERTRAGTAEWVVSEQARDHFELKTRNGLVLIGTVDKDGVPPFEFEIFDKQGNAVSRLESQWTEFLGAPSENAPWNSVLESLYGIARRKALKIDDVLKSILDDLEPF